MEKINHSGLLKALTITLIYTGGWVLFTIFFNHGRFMSTDRLFPVTAEGLLTGGFYLSVTTLLVYILINKDVRRDAGHQERPSLSDETQASRLRGRIAELEEALRNLKTLKGIIPICAHCKSIRNGSGGWIPIEKYIKEHSGAEFSHGLCPDCDKKLYGDQRMHFQTIAGKYMEN